MKYEFFLPTHRTFVKQFLILFGSMLVSIASVFSNEFQFISFFDPSNPSLSDNPASIAKMSGFYIDTNMPISYSSTNVIRESKYYKDIYSGNNEVQFKNENTKIINGKLGLNNYGITYNNHTSKFKDDLKNTNHFMKINEENFEKIKIGIVLGKNFGPLLVGVHQQIISMTSTIKTESVPELKYSVNYMQPTYGIMSSISFFFLSASYTPEVKTTLSREYTVNKNINFTVPSKVIYGIQFIKNIGNTLTLLSFDSGSTTFSEVNKTSDKNSTKNNIIQGGLVSFNFNKKYGVTFGQREYPLESLKIKKKFISLKINVLSQLRFGYNEFSITDKSGKNFGYKYPEFSVNFKIDFGKSDKEECEDPWKSNVVTSCR